MASIKKNLLLNAINTVVGILIPIVTFPYAARVLLPEGIGTVNFLNSIIGYITLFAFLGIPMYAIKEVAKYRDDKQARDTITIEILALSVVLCIFAYIAVFLLAAFVPQIHEQASLFYVLSITILLSAIGVNWFYQGIEDFKFITIRGTIIRLLAAVALFVFVKTKEDLLMYGWVLVGSTVGNGLVNFAHLRKHVAFNDIRWRNLRIWRHIGPAAQVFVMNLIISLYLQLNLIMLGLMSSETAVGYYTAGTKITHIALTLIGSLGVVLLPRCSNLINKGDKSEFKAVIHKSLDVTLALSLPMAVGLIILATPVTEIFCGPEFEPSIIVLILNAPVMVFLGLTNVMGFQILYPMDKVNLVILSVSVAAIVNIVLNIFLIPPYGATGAAIATLFAEFGVLVTQAIIGRKYYPFRIRDFFKFSYWSATAIMAAAVIAATFAIHSDLTKLAVGVSLGITVYFSYLILIKDSLVIGSFMPILKRFLHIHNV